MNETLNVLKQRRGCKSYQDRQITDAELDAVLEAGTYAPTGRNQQSPILVAVQNREETVLQETVRQGGMLQPDGTESGSSNGKRYLQRISGCRMY